MYNCYLVATVVFDACRDITLASPDNNFSVLTDRNSLVVNPKGKISARQNDKGGQFVLFLEGRMVMRDCPNQIVAHQN